MIESNDTSCPPISARMISFKLLQSKLNFEIEGTGVFLKWILQSSFKA